MPLFSSGHLRDRILQGYFLVLGFGTGTSLVAGIMLLLLMNTTQSLTEDGMLELRIADSLTRRILIADLEANRYMLDRNQSHVDSFEEQIADIHELLDLGSSSVNDQALQLSLDSIKNDIVVYRTAFKSIVQGMQAVTGQVNTRIAVSRNAIESGLSVLRLESVQTGKTGMVFDLSNLQSAFRLMETSRLEYFMNVDEGAFVLYRQGYSDALEALNHLKAQLSRQNSLARSTELGTAIGEYNQAFLEGRDKLLNINKIINTVFEPASTSMTGTILDMQKMIEGEVRSTSERLQILVSLTLAALVAATLLALILGYRLSNVIARRLTQPLEELSRAATRLAEQDLGALVQQLTALSRGEITNIFQASSLPIESSTDDETGVVIKAFNQIVQKFRESEHTFGMAFKYLEDLSTAAQRIVRGDLTTPVVPLSGQDVLGCALLDMMASLRQVREKASVRAERLETIHEIDRLASGKPDLQGLSQLIVQKAATMLGLEVVHLALNTDVHDSLVEAWYGSMPDFGNTIPPIKLTGNLKEPVFLDLDEGFPEALGDLAASIPRGYRSYCAIPVQLQSRSFGTLESFSTGPLLLDEDSKAFLSILAGQAAIASASVSYLELLEDLVQKRTVELVAARERAEEATRIKSKFLANMSHEIRTPMNGIIGLTEILLDMDMTCLQRDYAGKILSSAKGLLHLVNDILDFSRMEAGRLQLEKTLFNLADLLYGVADMMALEASRKGLELMVQIDPALPCWFEGDPLRISQILLNLTANAVKFTESGSVVIGAAPAAPGPEAPSTQNSSPVVGMDVYVRDTGPGIDPDKINQIFHPFTQSDNSITRRFGGSGLGLAICLQLARLMKGSIQVDSTPARGSTFTFRCSLPEAQEPARARKLLAPEGLRGKKIVVVAPDGTSRLALCTMLESFGFGAISASDATDARDATGSPPDLMLMEYPFSVSGMEVPGTPCIFMVNAREHEHLVHKSGTSDTRAWLVKPVSPARLLDAVTSALGQGPQEQTPQGSQGSPAKPYPNLRILVAEDNPVNQIVAKGLLERLGAVIDIAQNGNEAVQMVLETTRGIRKPYDVVFMDIQMPECDGYEATRQIRAVFDPTTLPVIAMTAHAMASDRQLCLDAGMNSHVGKPVGMDELKQVLKEISTKKIPKKNGTTGSGPLPPQGLDFEGAKSRLGIDDETGLELLKRFLADHAGYARDLSLALSESPKEAKRLAHTLKGLASYIGAYRLAALGSKLETAIAENDNESCQTLMNDLEEDALVVLSQARNLAGTGAADANKPPDSLEFPEKPGSLPPDIHDTLARLSKLAEAGLFSALAEARKFAETVRNTPVYPKACSIAEHCARMEFEQAVTCIKDLTQWIATHDPTGEHEAR